MNTRIALSGLSILTVLSLVGGATFALFSDEATATDNTFSTGNADLQIAEEGPDSPDTYLDTITGFTAENVFPGYSEDFIFWLKNNSLSISLDVDASFTDVNTTVNAAIADNLMVSFTCVTDNNSDGIFNDAFATAGPFSVNAWAAGSAQVATLAPEEDPDGQGPDEVECTMTASLSEAVDNDLAGSSVDFDAVFDGVQVVTP